jgi:hypothetical protein
MDRCDVGLDGRPEYSFKIGQLVCLKGSPRLMGVYLWSDPVLALKDEDPAGYVEIGSLGLVLAVHEGLSCKIFVNDIIGWADYWDLLPVNFDT